MSSPAPPPHKYPMISMPDAIDTVLSRAFPLEAIASPPAEAVGLVLAEDVVASRPHPPFPASIMDGYAVRSADCPGALAVVGAARAGAPFRADLGANEAAYITTGAPLPPGADAVAQIERVALEDDGATLRVRDDVARGQHVRQTGSDVKEGEILLPAGTIIGPHEVGVAALAGARGVTIRRAPRVAVFSTGDELVDPFADDASASSRSSAAPSSGSSSSSPSYGQVFDANRPMLLALAREAGATAIDLGVVRDDPAALAAALDDAILARGADVVVSSGGVSEGDKDHLKEVLIGIVGGGRCEGVVHFGRVMMKPGKPLTFAEVGPRPFEAAAAGGSERGRRRALAFGLPGNPVSAAVTFHLVVAPAIRRMLGWRDPRPRRTHATLSADIALDPERPEYHRAALEWTSGSLRGFSSRPGFGPGSGSSLPAFASLALSGGDPSAHPVAHSTGRQISSRLTSMLGAEALLELPRGPGTIKKGAVVSALVIGDLRAARWQLPRVYPRVEPPPTKVPFEELREPPDAWTRAREEKERREREREDRRRPPPPEKDEPGQRGGTKKKCDARELILTVVAAPGEEGAKAASSVEFAALRAVPAPWIVTIETAAAADSYHLKEAVMKVAPTSAIVVVAPCGPGAVTSAAAVVGATERGYPSLAPAMRAAVTKLGPEATKKELADEACGWGVNAGEVAGAVVVSAPPKDIEKALRAGVGELCTAPRENWGLTTS